MKNLVIKSKEDTRDFAYTEAYLRTATPYPRRVVHERLYVRDQKNLGSCGGQAMADAMDIMKQVVTSALYSYLRTRQLMQEEQGASIPVEGVDMRSLMKAAKEYGICLEELYPYDAYFERNAFPPVTPQALHDAEGRKIDLYARATNLDEFLRGVNEHRVLVIGTVWFSGYRTPEIHNGKAYLYPEGFLQGGHGMCVRGYDLDMKYTYKNGETYTGFALIDNSHGEDYGVKGEVWMPLDVFFGGFDITGGGDMTPYVFDAFVPIGELVPVRKEIVEMDVAPVIIDDRTLLPIRPIVEALGGTVDYYHEEKKTVCTLNGKRVTVWTGSKKLVKENI